jgi:hypothetical protein
VLVVAHVEVELVLAAAVVVGMEPELVLAVVVVVGMEPASVLVGVEVAAGVGVEAEEVCMELE